MSSILALEQILERAIGSPSAACRRLAYTVVDEDFFFSGSVKVGRTRITSSERSSRCPRALPISSDSCFAVWRYLTSPFLPCPRSVLHESPSLRRGQK